MHFARLIASPGPPLRFWVKTARAEKLGSCVSFDSLHFPARADLKSKRRAWGQTTRHTISMVTVAQHQVLAGSGRVVPGSLGPPDLLNLLLERLHCTQELFFWHGALEGSPAPRWPLVLSVQQSTQQRSLWYDTAEIRTWRLLWRHTWYVTRDVTSVGQRSSPWPCKHSESRGKISPRVEAVLFCAQFVLC